MKFAYADPPYFKMGKKLYGKHHAEAAVWDGKQAHIDLVNRLVAEYPDGWALSCNPADLKWLLPHTPDRTRVCAWVKTFHPIRPIAVQYAWEPVLVFGGRAENKGSPMVRDWYRGKPTRLTGLPGAKSNDFNDWILDLLNFKDGDTLDDIYPGTKGMEKAANRMQLWRGGL